MIVEPPTNDNIFPNSGMLSPTNTITHTIPVRTKHRFQWNSEKKKYSILSKTMNFVNIYQRSYILHIPLTTHCIVSISYSPTLFIMYLQETTKYWDNFYKCGEAVQVYSEEFFHYAYGRNCKDYRWYFWYNGSYCLKLNSDCRSLGNVEELCLVCIPYKFQSWILNSTYTESV